MRLMCSFFIAAVAVLLGPTVSLSQFGSQQGDFGARRGNAGGPTTSAPGPGLRWEYKVHARASIADLGKQDFTAGLNKLGDEGWELVAVPGVPGGHGGQAQEYYFKRRKGSAAQEGPAAREGRADAEDLLVVYTLKNAHALDLAKTLQQVFAGKADRAAVVADPHTNSLIIRGTQKQAHIVVDLVQRLDTPGAEGAARLNKP